MALQKIKTFAEMIKFEHTIFALPFAYLGAFLAQKAVPSWYQIFWITMAMVGARTSAMALNRLIDRTMDARNPRTANRAIPKGFISSVETFVYIVLSLLLLFISAVQLNPLCVKLMPVAVFFLVFYSYTKRFTWGCHLVLGITDGLAPLGGWVAITGSINLDAIYLFLAVTTWIAGFDVIYACQDYEFDANNGMHSIPVRFGLRDGLRISILLHIFTALFFIILAFTLNMGIFYWVGLIISIFILIYEHYLVKPNDLSKMNAAFFNLNSIISAVMFVFTLADILILNKF